jgi:hypothetical protein
VRPPSFSAIAVRALGEKMTVMRGSLKFRRALVVLAVVTLSTVVGAVPAGATSDSNHNPNNYLALGDSVPFGYNPLLRAPGVNPDVFVGYPELASQLFRPRKKLWNASCPGETSGSFISTARPDNGCQGYRLVIGDLHVPYTGSQLDFARQYVAANPRTGLITMTIGANDLFLLARSCANNPVCIGAGLPGLLGNLQANLTTIYTALRDAGFQGTLVALTYYATNYRDLAGVGAISAINATLAAVTEAFGGLVADGFTAFMKATTDFNGDACAAGLLIRTPAGCDIHPSPAGAALLAQTVAGVS